MAHAAALEEAKRRVKEIATGRLVEALKIFKGSSGSDASPAGDAVAPAVPPGQGGFGGFGFGRRPPAAPPPQTTPPSTNGGGQALLTLIGALEVAQEAHVEEGELLREAAALAKERAVAEVRDESTHERDLEVLGGAIRIVQRESWAEQGAVVAARTRLTTTTLKNAIAEAKGSSATRPRPLSVLRAPQRRGKETEQKDLARGLREAIGAATAAAIVRSFSSAVSSPKTSPPGWGCRLSRRWGRHGQSIGQPKASPVRWQS